MHASGVTGRLLRLLVLILMCQAAFTHAPLVGRSPDHSPFEEWKPSPPLGNRRLQENACTTNGDCAFAPVCGYCDQGTNQCVDQTSQPCGTQGNSVCFSGYCVQGCATTFDCYSQFCNECTNAGFATICTLANQGAACSEGGVQGTCEAQGAGYAQGVCKNSVVNDPVIGGFDGKKFHFDEVGNFTLLQEGHGWRVDVTFSSAPELEGGLQSKESSWTTGVRVHSPQGDLVSCSIPAVHPNTSLVTMSVTAAGGEAQPVTPSRQEPVSLHQMSARPTLSWKEYAGVQYSAVVGCRVATPLMDINVYQVSGWEEALAKPEEHGWAAPFTWLNLDFTMKERLAAPVTGILGATYPQKAMLGAGTDVASAKSVETEDAELAARALLDEDTSFQGLSFSVVGL